jgi:tetrahydromethanopterin S-methyltransferase subunit C
VPDVTDLLRSIIRTGVPALVGVVVGWLARRGLDVDDVIAQQAVTWLTGVAYYALVRFAERLGPRWGWLLGAPGAPTYGAAADH